MVIIQLFSIIHGYYSVLGTYSQCLEENSHTELLWQQNGHGGREFIAK